MVAEELAKCQAQLLGVQVAQAESSQGSAVEALREELTELQLWRAEEEAVSSKRRPELLQEAELLHRELASAQEKMLGLKRENKRLVTDKRLANDEIEELRARMEDALAEIDDLHEVIQLQEQLELEADAISNISTSGIADIIKACYAAMPQDIPSLLAHSRAMVGPWWGHGGAMVGLQLLVGCVHLRTCLRRTATLCRLGWISSRPLCL